MVGNTYYLRSRSWHTTCNHDERINKPMHRNETLMNTHNVCKSCSPPSSRHTGSRRASKQSQHRRQLGQKNSDGNVLQSLGEAHSVRQHEDQGPLLEKPVLDSPTTVPLHDSPDSTRRPVDVRLWELEVAWAAERSVRWQ